MIRNHLKDINKIMKQTNLYIIIFLLLIILILSNLNYLNYYLAHSIFQNIGSIIVGGIFMFSINSYELNKNDFLINLGIGYLFVAIFDLIHSYSSVDMIIFNNTAYDISEKFWIVARFIEIFTFLNAVITLFKKNANHYVTFIVFLIISSILIIDIIYLNKIIPILGIEGQGITQIKVILEYVIMAGFVLCLYIYYRLRSYFDHNLFLYLILSLITKVASALFFTMDAAITDNYNLAGHLFKVVSFYLLYKGIIVTGIKRPVELINNDLEEVDKSLAENENQRKLLEYAMLHNEQCNELLINNSSNGLMIIRDNKIIYINDTHVSLLGAAHYSEIKRKSIFDFLHEDYIDWYYEKLEDINKNKGFEPFTEIKLKSVDGESIDIEGSLNYITYRGQPALLAITRDIRHQKKLELDIIESERKLNASYEYNKLHTEFFSNISHELRTPLNIILGSIQLLEHDNEVLPKSYDQKMNKITGIMKQNTYRLIRLTDNLIDITKYETGYVNLKKHNYDIINVVEEITFSVGQYFKYRDINIIFDTDVEEKIMAVDIDMIERIIMNLLSNAVKFTRKNDEIMVYIHDLGDQIAISVKDTGIGIPKEKLSKIFLRFEQVDRTYTRNREGSGIGLSMVKKLTELHGGSIEVKSILGEGSEFIINLPVTVVEDEELEVALTTDDKIDRINIEFSDIYSNE